MAAIRSGLVAFSCERCKEAPYSKEAWGCGKTLSPEMAIMSIVGEEFLNCPIKFITESTYDFLEKMDSYANRLSTPPDFEKHSAKFLLAVKTFDQYLTKFIAIKKGE